MGDGVVAILERAVEAGTLPGWVLAAGHGERTELLAAGGSAELEPDPRPMTTATRFDIASLTKVVATLPIVLRLIVRGELGLSTRADEVLAGGPAATVEQLLTHTAGLPPDPDPALRDTLTGDDLADAILATAPVAAPGTAVVYSDVGFLVLGRLAETVAGRPLDALLADEVTGPLGLRHTGYGPVDRSAAPVVAATEPRPDGTPVRGTVHDETAAALAPHPAGHAGVFSDATDLARYLAAWCDPGDHWLPAELRAAATRDRTGNAAAAASAAAATSAAADTATAGTGHRGLGWTARHDPYDQLGEEWPPTAVFHSGFTGTSLALDPVSTRWVVLLTNDVHLGRGRGRINPLRRAVHTVLAP